MNKDREGIVFGLMTPEEQAEILAIPKNALQVLGVESKWGLPSCPTASHPYPCYAYRTKPAPLPKLTLEWIESHGSWPEGAKIAVVNDNGSGWFGECKDAQPISREWQPIGGPYDWVCVNSTVLFDSTDWHNSLIRRPVAKKKVPLSREEWYEIRAVRQDNREFRILEVSSDGQAIRYRTNDCWTTEGFASSSFIGVRWDGTLVPLYREVEA